MRLLPRPSGLRLNFDMIRGTGPSIIFLPGYASDRAGTKALALEAWARREGRTIVRFDYGGCGTSEGVFEEQTLDDWLDDALLVIDRLTRGPVVLVGSSMGGWIALLAAVARPARVAAVVGIAAAPDFTDWGFDAERIAALRRDGRLAELSRYTDQTIVTTRAFWESGGAHLLLGGEIAIDCPVRLLHGQADGDVPYAVSLRAADALRSADVQTILVKDGDHRLSRDADIALLLSVIASLPPP